MGRAFDKSFENWILHAPKFQKYQYHLSMTPKNGDIMLQSQIIQIAKFCQKNSLISSMSSSIVVFEVKVGVVDHLDPSNGQTCKDYTAEETFEECVSGQLQLMFLPTLGWMPNWLIADTTSALGHTLAVTSTDSMQQSIDTISPGMWLSQFCTRRGSLLNPSVCSHVSQLKLLDHWSWKYPHGQMIRK